MKGILFKPELLRAIREGRKTVTRRLMKPQPIIDRGILRWNHGKEVSINMTDHANLAVPYARYLPGETVYVKEGYRIDAADYTQYRLDDPKGYWIGKWKSAMFMPQSAARTFLLIKSVRPERLQEITEEDAIAEGIGQRLVLGNLPDVGGLARSLYVDLWDSINKKPGTRWGDNPYVWRIEFSPEGKK